MKNLKHFHKHQCAPADWRNVHDITGSYELDGMVERVFCRGLGDKLENHLMGDDAYKINTSYGRGPIG